MDYPAGSLKQHPATLSIALRTDSPDDSFTAWAVAYVDQPPRYVPASVVCCWPGGLHRRGTDRLHRRRGVRRLATVAASCESATPRFRNDVGRAGFNDDGPRRACF